LSKIFSYKGKKLTPLTPAEAASLDRGDKLKYIGDTLDTGYLRSGRIEWGSYWGRNVISLPDKPFVKSDVLNVLIVQSNSYVQTSIESKIKNLALVERGDPSAFDFKKAKRYIPVNLKGFKQNLQNQAMRVKENIDFYLEALPLHKKLELFSKLTPQEMAIYNFLYKDIDEVVGLKDVEGIQKIES